MKSILTPREFAESIGVSESSVKRWVDNGEIVASRAAGGHRRISVQEAGRYIREHGIALVRPDILGLAELGSPVDRQQLPEGVADRFFDFLRSGADAEARGMLVSLYLEGMSVAEIVDGPLCEAMDRVGELWTTQPSGIFWEHRATQIVMQALGRLRTLVPVKRDAPFAVGGAIAGDPYILPSLAVTAVLEGEGLRAVNLGAETPVATLALGVDDLDARLAWMSVSVARNVDRLRDEIVELLADLAKRGTTLVVGGSQAKKLRLPRNEWLYVGGSMIELEAFVKGLKLAPAVLLPA